MFDRSYYLRRVSALKQGRYSFEPQWRDVEEYVLPGSVEFTTYETNRGDRKNLKVLNDTGTDASRTLSSGMMGGLTSPARPWFQVRTSNPGRNQKKNVAVWLDTVSKNMAGVFLRSNIYQVLPQFYDDLGGFATGVFVLLEDDDSVIRGYHCPVGSYWLGTSHRGVVDTYAREFRMTARQMVAKFGKEQCSSPVQTAADRSDDSWFPLTHLVEPNPEFDPAKPHSKFKPFRSTYFETTGDLALSEAGYDEFPVIAARWSVRGSGVYGNRCPGFQCLGDVKSLQLGEKRGWQALDKLVNPPLTAPSSLKTSKVSMLPGDITYVDVSQGQQGVKTLYEINPHLAELDARLQRLERRIQRAFFVDLFLMISNMDGIQPRNTAEINVRKEEKMIMLGPTLERLNDEAFDPLIKRTFGIMWRRSQPLWGTPQEDQALIPPPPEELGAGELIIEYVSILAQAQKLIGTAALEKLTAFIGNLLQAFPDVADKYDADQAIDDYAEMVGAGPKTIRDAKDVAARRAARAQQAQAQQAMATMQQGAQTAQTLGSTPMNPDTALGAMLGRLGQPQ